jgi:outer membrane protein assembly factor BamB
MFNFKKTTKSLQNNIREISILFLLAIDFIPSAIAVELKLTAPSGYSYDNFGNSVAIDNNRALIGSRGDDDKGTNSGAAYLFDATTGSMLYKFTAPNSSDYWDFFGNSVALNGNRALIGSNSYNDKGIMSGSAYLFDINTGHLLHKLTAPDGSDGDLFGYSSVALNVNTALIGSYRDNDNGLYSGSAYLFDTMTGNLLRKFTAPDGSSLDEFGRSIALSDKIALISSIGDDDKGSGSGSAYLFDINTGHLLHKLTAPDGNKNHNFGWSVALNDNIALIGAHRDYIGSVYVFDTTTGALLYKLTTPDDSSGDLFGRSVALNGDTALIGFRDNEKGIRSGSAYLFDINTGHLLQKFTGSDSITNDDFGYSLAINNNIALISSVHDDDKGINSGSTYLFTFESKSDPSSIPEPSSLWGIVGILAIALFSRNK